MVGKGLVGGMRIACVAAWTIAAAASFADANTVWSQRAFGSGGGNLEWADGLVLPSGRVVACGTEYGTRSTLIVQAWEADGIVAWTYRYPDAGDLSYDRGAKIATNGNDIFVAGTTNMSVSSTVDDAILIKLSSNGAQLDTNPFSTTFGSFDEHICGLAVCPDDTSQVVMTGYAGPVNSTHSGWLIRTQTDLDPDWVQNLAYDAVVTPGGPLPTSDGKIYVPSEGDSLGASYRAALTRYGASGALEANYQVASATMAKQPIARAANGDIAFVCEIGGGVQLSKLTSGLALVGSQLINDHFCWGASVAWSEQAQALYLCMERYTEDLLEVRKYSPTAQLLWSDTTGNKLNHLASYMLKTDRFGNPVVVGDEELGDGNVNFVAWCWDPFGYRQYKSAFAQSQTSNDYPAACALDDELRLYAIGKAVNPDIQANQTKGAIWRTSQYFHRAPDSGAIREGYLRGGAVSNLVSVDGAVLVAGALDSRGLIAADFDMRLPIEIFDPASITLNVKATFWCSASGTTIRWLLYDWTTSTWRVQWVGSASTTAQSVTAPIANPELFVQPGTQLVRARLVGQTSRRLGAPLVAFLDSLEVCADK